MERIEKHANIDIKEQKTARTAQIRIGITCAIAVFHLPCTVNKLKGFANIFSLYLVSQYARNIHNFINIAAVPWTCKTCVTYISSDENRFFFFFSCFQNGAVFRRKSQVQSQYFAIRFFDSLYFVWRALKSFWVTREWAARRLYGYCHTGLVV